jgi:crotonobetainyl-CoA:carnitine CoA-transferase CaiB-like acyl-CoA transferase
MTSTYNHDPAEQPNRSRSAGELIALEQLLAEIGLSDNVSGDATLVGDELLIRSPHRLVEAVGTAQLLIGGAAAAIWLSRTGEANDVFVDSIDALHSLHSSHFVWQGGAYLEVGAEYVPVNGFYPTKDGRQVFLCAGPPYMKLLNAYLDLFACANNRQAIAAATMRYTAAELEEALAEIGVPGCRAFDREEWLAHPQGRLLAATPVVEIEKVAEGEPVPFGPSGEHPLSGTRVLDFTHVLAGPHSTQCLAEFGADVLHVSSALHHDTLPQHLGVDMGKYCTYLDLRNGEQLRRMHELAVDADVFVSSYRDSVNDRFGLTPAALAARSPRGIVGLSINTYGHSGPWRHRAGFDPNGQAASGFAAAEGSGVRSPNVSPVSYLADLLSGYLGAAGMMAALLRRATEGGSYHVKVSLTRSAMWVQELGLLDLKTVEGLPETDAYPYRSETATTSFGSVETLANPIRFSTLQLAHNGRLVPYGADPAQWP